MTLKTNKSALKRFKITKHKMLHRPPRQNHFNARATGNQTRQKRGYKNLPALEIKNMLKVLPFN